MSRDRYQPGPPGDADLRPDGDRWTLVFVRELRHPPELVWKALTEPSQLKEWAPFDADRDLGRTGDATLTMEGEGGPEPMTASVRQARPPALLEYTWGTDLLRWELEPIPTGTRLTLRHTLEDRSWASKVVAGWHICLDVAEGFLDGRPIGRIVGDEARRYGWERLHDLYAKRLGLESSGEAPPPHLQTRSTEGPP